MFLAFEGGDQAGKTTQVELLASWLRDKGHDVVVTREPGATQLGRALRTLLLDVGQAPIAPLAEALLYAADRAQHVAEVVRPALARGAVVVTDRYVDSSIAYQGAGRRLGTEGVARTSAWATGSLVPDLTVLLDVAPAEARARSSRPQDRLESEPPDFHDRVRAQFLALAGEDAGRYLVVDGDETVERVHVIVRERVRELIA